MKNVGESVNLEGSSMKPELDSRDKIFRWMMNPRPAIFQGQNLMELGHAISKLPLDGCVFLGCNMGNELLAAAATSACFIVPPRPDLPFEPFMPSLYSPSELFESLARDGDYRDCLDFKIYDSYLDIQTRIPKPVDVDVALMRRIHDASITDALEDLFDESTRLRTVAIMGGHDIERSAPIYKQVAELALRLTQSGYLIATGGGPGLMEAGNLGAYCAGFSDPLTRMSDVMKSIEQAPTYKDPNWLTLAFAAWRKMGSPNNAALSRNVGIPTWFYGHEPPNVFATDIARYFENSVREEGLLAFASAGIIFAPGNGGTVQEVFQDANQNYYRTYLKKKSPMILLGVDYWNPVDPLGLSPHDKRKPVFPLLQKLAIEKEFNDYLMNTDDPNEIVKFIQEHPPVA